MTREAIYNEVFLDLYDKWGPGRYYSGSTRKVILIKTMNVVHLRNAIQQLTEQRKTRLGQILSLEDDGDIITEIKADYIKGNDVISFKISELLKELSSRDL